MTFKDISIKIFKANIKRYLAYFLSSSFTIAVFFIFSSLIFNKEFTETHNSATTVFGMSLLIVGVFSIFFISYTHTSFIKSRNKEFGLFLTLGMTTKDIGRIIRIENGIVAILSLVLGLVSGSVFARLFFMVILKILEIEEISFNLNIYSYLLTISVFLFIFLIVVFISYRATRKLEITDLLKENRKAINKAKNRPLVGVIGIILVLISFLLFYLHLEGKLFPDKNNWMIAFLAITLIGLYFVISEFGSIIIVFLKRNKLTYYNNLLNITEINYRYRSNIKIIYIITILSAVVILFIGAAYSMYAQALEMAENEHPYHLAYVLDRNDDEETKANIEKLIVEANSPVVERKSIQYINGGIPKDYNGQQVSLIMPAISESNYKLLSGKDFDLKTGQAATLLFTNKPEHNQGYIYQETEYLVGDQKYNFEITHEEYGIPMNNIVNTRMIIINDEDYDDIVQEIGDQPLAELNLINFTDWKAIDGLATEINEVQFSKYDSDVNFFKPHPASRIEVFNFYKHEYAFYLFVLSFIGILFFITSANVLYFKLKNDIEESKAKFNILTKIGIQSKEIKRIISNELILIFYIPFLIGLILGYSFLWVLSVNITYRTQILIDTLLVAFIYFIFQTSYFLLARKKHIDEIIG